MLTLLRRFTTLAAFVALASPLAAQQPTTITGRVSDENGQAIDAANVEVQGMNLGGLTNAQGRYLIIIPASRVTGQTVTLRASLIGRASATQTVTLRPGTMNVDFTLTADPLKLEELVVTGVGITAQRQTLGATINTVEADQIQQSHESNIVSALAGKAPNVEVTSSSGDPGAGSYIQIRGANSLLGSNQPLFVVDGQPIDNSSTTIEDPVQGTVTENRAMDLNPNDIQSIDILKGAAAAAIYGSRAANGVVLITTKSGRPGQNRVEYRSSLSWDEVNKTVPVQTSFGQGLAGVPGVNDAFGVPPGTIPESGEICIDIYGLPTDRCPTSWGLPISGPAYDHATEIYHTGFKSDQFMSWSGGSEGTDYYLSLGRLDHTGVIRGNSDYQRTTVRLKGSHSFRDDLRVGGNLAYTAGNGDFIQQGSNISGIQLAALRTPPDFNNLPYLTDTGLQRTYRLPNPTSITQSRGYDNPFWVANAMTNKSTEDRTFGQVNAQYTPFDWLSVNYTLGVDYSANERRTVIPKSSSDFPQGRLVRADLMNLELDHNLVATLKGSLTPDIGVELNLGQNLNQREFRRYQVDGKNLILGTNQLDFTVDKIPDEYTETIRTDGYFGQASFNMWDQLYLTAALRYDGSSTFGNGTKRFAYPKFSGAWDFSKYLDNTPVSFAKAHLAYGVAGKQPPVYSNVSAFETTTITDGWLQPNGLLTIYKGNEGVVSEPTLGNENIKPERTREYEAGVNMAFFDNRFSFDVTYYNQHTTDAILAVNTAPSTGFTSKYANAAEFKNTGWEVTSQLNVLQSRNVRWDLSAQWAKSHSCTLDLAGAEEFSLSGFVGSTSSVVAPERDANGNITKCYQIGALYTDDFVRFGRGSTVGGVDIDATYTGWKPGDLYIGSDGFPRYDGQSRVTGDPNPDWTGSLRNTLTIANNFTISGLLDIKHGGQMWNGTRGALDFFGTAKDTEPYHGDGQTGVFGQTYMPNEHVAGPGAGQSVDINWLTWFWNGLGSGFTGPSSQYIEDAGYVKLREIAVSYTLRDMDWMNRIGFNSLDISLAGRNLYTWTNYTGIDPESNLTGQTLGRGIDYFNNPQTRSWVLNFTFTH